MSVFGLGVFSCDIDGFSQEVGVKCDKMRQDLASCVNRQILGQRDTMGESWYCTMMDCFTQPSGDGIVVSS